ncbi:MAG: hypothetical protein EOM24_03255 [Chloroflexia bacterium]|nr:hypothetical protein [Chloroflexia bacterium]
MWAPSAGSCLKTRSRPGPCDRRTQNDGQGKASPTYACVPTGVRGNYYHGRASGLIRTAQSWCIETDQGSVAARNVVLALSLVAQPRWPPWATDLREAGAAVRHLYAPAEPVAAGADTVIIGGGISAAQVALALAERELELLGWLPTSAMWIIHDLLWHERERQTWLLRLGWRRHSTNEGQR